MKGIQRRGFLGVAVAAILPAVWPATALAQPVPDVRSVSPQIVMPGRTTEIMLSGENVADVRDAIVVEGEGVEIRVKPTTQPSKAKSVRAVVTVKADAPRGGFSVRVVTPNGVSRPVALTVDDFPSVAEREPNDSFGKAQRVELPGVIVGAIGKPMEADHFRFAGKKGRRLIFDVQAHRLGSKLDSSLTLFDADGIPVAADEDTNGLDSLIDFTVPADGEYVLKIQDLRYGGAGDYTYRIRAGEIPYVDAVFPLGGRRGGNMAVELIGRNLPSPRMNLSFDAAAPLGKREVSAPTDRGGSNSLPFEVGDSPEVIEAEPNDLNQQANPAALPVVVNGRIGRPGDVDTYKLRPTTNQPVAVEISARRYGSPLDALLTLRDAAGNVLTHNDDAMGADARLEIRDGKDKDYYVSVTDLVGRGGETFAYRLAVRENVTAPDFAVVFPPETTRVSRLGTGKIWCEVKRSGGFDGDVTVRLEGLSAGVSCEPLLFKAKEPNSGLMAIGATAAARPGTYPLRVVATGKIGEKDVTRTLKSAGYSAEPRTLWLTVTDTPLFIVDRVGPGTGDEDPKAVREQIAALNKVLNTQTPELDAGLEKWAAAQAKDAWEPLEFVTAGAKERAEIKPQGDGSLLVRGPNPQRDFYTVVLKTKAKNLKAFKLEALVDGKGPGRAADGNFVISKFSVTAAPESNTGAATAVELHKPMADFAQAGFSIDDTLKETTDRGWAVHPKTAENHWAVWEVKNPVGFDEGTVYTFTIKHDYPGSFGLARFRILGTAADGSIGGFSLPSNVMAALATAKDKRADEQKKALGAHYRSFAPELRDVRERLAELKTAGAAFPPETTPNASTSVAVRITRLNGFDGPVTLTAEGYTPGLDANQQPNAIARSFQTQPASVGAGQAFGKVDLKAVPNAEKGTRTIVIKAEANVGGVVYTQYSPLIPLTVKDPPPVPAKKEAEAKK